MTLSLVVKGPRESAEKAASLRRIPFHFSHETPDPYTIGYTSEFYVAPVAKWLAESYMPPFPDGTLLLYSHHERS